MDALYSQKTIAFLDVGQSYYELREELDAAWREVMLSGTYIHGNNVTAFEGEFARYCGAGHTVGVANGYDALVLGLRAAGVQAGDEVLVSGHTFIATWLAILALGAVPVPVDADPATMLLDPALIAGLITPRTRALVAVHLYGLPVDLTSVSPLLRERNITVIEDAAQAHGATLHGVKAGALGDIAAFSFYPGKNLGAFGDGGAITFANGPDAERARIWANYGAREKYRHEEIGLNSRLDELQAAVLRIKLRKLDEWTDRRRNIAARYLEGLAGVGDLTLPLIPFGANPAWHLFVLRHPRRDLLKRRLDEMGVRTLMHYPVPPHRSGALAGMFGQIELPVTDAICDTCLSLPMGPHLSLDDADRVIEAVSDAGRTLPAR